ncbi:MAG: efflux RND transporter periplasmic adaptor subunit [Pseudomonadota bacterium]
MMNRKALLACVALACAGAGYALYAAGLQQGMRQGAPQVAKAAPAIERKPLYWHDPMVPGQRFDKPGKSPFMDMQLVPVYADEPAQGGASGALSVSAQAQQNLGMRIAPVVAGRLGGSLEAPGSIAYNERELVLVQARAAAFVEKLYVRSAFEPVRKGQPLVELFVPDWLAAQEEFLAVRRMGNGAPAAGLLDAARQRMRIAGMDEAQMRQVEASGKVAARMTITAPVGGVIGELGAREGMAVASGALLFRINGLDTVWLNADLPEALGSRFQAGSAVQARVNALAGKVFKGSVAAVLPEVNAATRTLKLRIELANPTHALVPGMFASVSLQAEGGEPALLVPSEALIQTGTRSVVMRALGAGRFEPVEVEAGREANGQTEILKGLGAGDKVVVSGQFLLDSEASLKGFAARTEHAK